MSSSILAGISDVEAISKKAIGSVSFDAERLNCW